MSIKTVFYIGVIGSGKDYRADRYVSENPGSVKLAFADPLREIVWDILEWKPSSDKEYQEFKSLVFRSGIVTFPLFNGRNILTGLGEAIKKHDPYFFANRFVQRVSELEEEGYTTVVCSDLRFPVELEAIFDNEMFETSEFIFCDYRSDRYNPSFDDISERMAQSLFEYGLKDGDVIPLDIIHELF